MLQDPLFLAVVVSVGLVLAILFVGVISFGLGGEFNRKHSNRLMRYRIIAQAVAVVMVLLFIWVRRDG